VESNVKFAVARPRAVARPGYSTVGSSMVRGGRVHRGRIRLVRHGRSIEVRARERPIMVLRCSETAPVRLARVRQCWEDRCGLQSLTIARAISVWSAYGAHDARWPAPDGIAPSSCGGGIARPQRRARWRPGSSSSDRIALGGAFARIESFITSGCAETYSRM
jgi:plasmid stability protein